MSRITVIGSINMDLVISAPRVPKMGETILGDGFITVPGGKGANQAVAASRLGGNVSMIGCVGDDIFGKDLMDNLAKNNVDTKNIRKVEGISTGVAIIVLKDGDNFIIVDSGANSKLSPEMVLEAEDLIKDSFMVAVQLEIPLQTVLTSVKLAKKHRVKVLLDPAPAMELDDELLSNIDIITPNEIESEFLTGIKINNIDHAKESVKYLKGLGIPQVIITLGGKGVVYNIGDQIIHKPVSEVKVVDTTAAGDSFSGAIAYSLSQKRDMERAIEFANIVGSVTVTKKGAQTSLPTMAEINQFIKKQSGFDK